MVTGRVAGFDREEEIYFCGASEGGHEQLMMQVQRIPRPRPNGVRPSPVMAEMRMLDVGILRMRERDFLSGMMRGRIFGLAASI